MVRVGRHRDTGQDWGRQPGLPRPLPLLSAPSPNRFGQVLRPPARHGRVWACKPVCLDPPHKQACPLHQRELSRAQPLTPPSASPLLPPAGLEVSQRLSGPGKLGQSSVLQARPERGSFPWEDVGEPEERDLGRESQHRAGFPTGEFFPLLGGGEGCRVSHSVTRACIGKKARETRSFLRPPPKSLLFLWPLSLPPCPPPASRRECRLLSSPERALPELHFWDNSALLGLALCQLPPTLADSLWLTEAGPQLVLSQHPVPWWV